MEEEGERRWWWNEGSKEDQNRCLLFFVSPRTCCPRHRALLCSVDARLLAVDCGGERMEAARVTDRGFGQRDDDREVDDDEPDESGSEIHSHGGGDDGETDESGSEICSHGGDDGGGGGRRWEVRRGSSETRAVEVVFLVFLSFVVKGKKIKRWRR